MEQGLRWMFSKREVFFDITLQGASKMIGCFNLLVVMFIRRITADMNITVTLTEVGMFNFQNHYCFWESARFLTSLCIPILIADQGT